MNKSVSEYGPVVIEGWFDELTIGYYDDDCSDESAVIFVGDPFFALQTGHYIVPHKYLRPVEGADLWDRHNILSRSIGPSLYGLKKSEKPSDGDQYRILLELNFISSLIMDRLYMAQFGVEKGEGHLVFISHSSVDKPFAKELAVSLSEAGHRPWLDEWEIKAGESIPKKVAQGIEDCQYLVVILSSASVQSSWVENEWQSKYWSEVENGTVMVIPVLYEQCEVPTLLRSKKYANFTSSRRHGLEELLAALFISKAS